MAAPTNAANVKKALANSEPSTHGPKQAFGPPHEMSDFWRRAGASFYECTPYSSSSTTRFGSTDRNASLPSGSGSTAAPRMTTR